ncbi:MoaD/ThiS family protein [Desulfofundulus sp. TPOSR]|uniref:MoaD/ThiS family protein n=1 Tax=Desulfofundulus sp. TPOSR TaxID=2714340 RepID=UPI00140A033F|nr:MoaD/ThiS family protein [Desulfofundulus sp. TPOSR]NHM26107.1 MoaD/ThiS family protein [Desulfofundulus sp. TPOSR]
MKVKVKLLAPFKFCDGTVESELEVPRNSTVRDLVTLIAERSNIDKYGRDQVMILAGNKIVGCDDLIDKDMEAWIMLQPMGG